MTQTWDSGGYIYIYINNRSTITGAYSLAHQKVTARSLVQPADRG